MDDVYPILRRCQLFADIKKSELQSLLKCLLARRERFEKGSFVYVAGDDVRDVGIVLSGAVHILHEDFWGNRSVLSSVLSCDLFGEAFPCADVKHLPVSVMAVEPTDILFVDLHKIITPCSSCCDYHTRLIKNIMQVLAQKNIVLMQKIEHLTQRSTREKLLSFLSLQAEAHGSHSFKIFYNRQELADFLAVDRSAMSAELSRMRDEGILDYDRSHFVLQRGALGERI